MQTAFATLPIKVDECVLARVCNELGRSDGLPGQNKKMATRCVYLNLLLISKATSILAAYQRHRLTTPVRAGCGSGTDQCFDHHT